MNQTRTQRIHRGFHRVGIMLSAIVFMIGASIAFAVSDQIGKATEVGTISIVFVVAIYALCRAAGWVLAGFVGD